MSQIVSSGVYKRLAIVCLALLSCLTVGYSRKAFSQTGSSPFPSPGLAPTPPMGWASWNPFFCDYNDQTIREQADALVASGMRDLGYKYVLIQECIAPGRNASGELIIDSARFPHGMKNLVDYVHSRGLKAGTYTDVGPYTCFPNPRYQGSYEHEAQDAKTFASWGMDFVEMDYCNRVPEHSGREVYERMAAAIQATGRPMLFYICSWGNESPWTWAQGKAQLWRIDADISGKENHVDWKDVVLRFESGARHAAFSAPNSWNDPDMLEVGNNGLSLLESQTHMSMWAISAAPLWAGNDLTHMTDSVRSIYTNPEVVAIDQDPLGAGVTKVKEDAVGLEVWSKPLGSIASGVDAVLLLNLTDAPSQVAVQWSDLNLSGKVLVRDLYTHETLGGQSVGYRATIPAHGSVLLKVSGTYMWSKGAIYEAEWPGNLRGDNAELLTCPECSNSYAISLTSTEGTSEPAALTFTHVVMPKAGKYWLSLYYADSHINTDKLRLRVNDDQPAPIAIRDFIYGSETVPVSLKEGDNSLTFSYADTAGRKVNLDRIGIYQ
jgi:alpha-galactosidase